MEIAKVIPQTNDVYCVVLTNAKIVLGRDPAVMTYDVCKAFDEMNGRFLMAYNKCD